MAMQPGFSTIYTNISNTPIQYNVIAQPESYGFEKGTTMGVEHFNYFFFDILARDKLPFITPVYVDETLTTELCTLGEFAAAYFDWKLNTTGQYRLKLTNSFVAITKDITYYTWFANMTLDKDKNFTMLLEIKKDLSTKFTTKEYLATSYSTYIVLDDDLFFKHSMYNSQKAINSILTVFPNVKFNDLPVEFITAMNIDISEVEDPDAIDMAIIKSYAKRLGNEESKKLQRIALAKHTSNTFDHNVSVLEKYHKYANRAKTIDKNAIIKPTKFYEMLQQEAHTGQPLGNTAIKSITIISNRFLNVKNAIMFNNRLMIAALYLPRFSIDIMVKSRPTYKGLSLNLVTNDVEHTITADEFLETINKEEAEILNQGVVLISYFLSQHPCHQYKIANKDPLYNINNIGTEGMVEIVPKQLSLFKTNYTDKLKVVVNVKGKDKNYTEAKKLAYNTIVDRQMACLKNVNKKDFDEFITKLNQFTIETANLSKPKEEAKTGILSSLF